jgi:TraY domain
VCKGTYAYNDLASRSKNLSALLHTMAKRLGRPPEAPKPGRLVPLSFRVTAEIRKKLEEAAAANGRSLSAEAEFRLTDSFSKDEVVAVLEEVRENRKRVEGMADDIRLALDEALKAQRKQFDADRLTFDEALKAQRKQFDAELRKWAAKKK